MTKIDDTLFNRLKKVYQLAEFGLPGERDNAARILKGLLKKYELSIDDLINHEKKATYYFKYRNKSEECLLVNIICMVLNVTGITFSRIGCDNEIGIELTALQYTEIKELYKIYASAFRQEVKKTLDDLLNAFLHKNDLFSEKTKNCANGTDKPDEHEKEDVERILRIISLIRSMDKVQRPYKQIEMKGVTNE